jgi:hypothetical protein
VTIDNEHERAAALTRNHSSEVDDRRKAALRVAAAAQSPDDCRDLLQALGLVDQGFRWVGDRYHGTRRKVTE